MSYDFPLRFCRQDHFETIFSEERHNQLVARGNTVFKVLSFQSYFLVTEQALVVRKKMMLKGATSLLIRLWDVENCLKIE